MLEKEVLYKENLKGGLMQNLVSIIIPTRNESKNITKLIDAIWRANVPNQYEVVVVDDSSDDTAEKARSVGARVVYGKGQGLGQAIIDGITKAYGDTIVVMDADLSHDPSALPAMILPILEQGYDMTIGSRYTKGGGTSGWELSRRIISRCACLLALPITSVKDATSGYFAFRKSLIKNVKLEASSWKIMLEILLKTKPTRILEVPIMFKVRELGKSKFDKTQMIAYLKHIGLLAFWKYQKFLKFCIVGGIGALITFSITWLATEFIGFWYMFSLVIAVIIATISNFTLNSLWTFKLAEDPNAPDYEWKSFFRGNLVQKWWKQSIAKTVWKWLPNTSTLLDIGCGSSPVITRYPEAVAIDTNELKLEFMRAKFPAANYSVMSATHLHFQGNEFDHIICIEVLEHLSSPKQAVKEMSRVLKENGKVIIATPDYSRKLWQVAERFTPYKEEHVMHFTRESLEELCAECGLKPTRYKYIATCDLIEEFVKIT
jgi:dolichol-phosphate mannosyltransferase